VAPAYANAPLAYANVFAVKPLTALSARHADRGQIDCRARAFGPHHRSDRRGGVPAGAQLVAVIHCIGLAAQVVVGRSAGGGRLNKLRKELGAKGLVVLGLDG
jgi:hypothetical protein